MLFLFAVLLGFTAANAQVTQGRIGNGDITISGTDWTDVYGLDFDDDGTLEFRISDFDGGGFGPTVTNGYISFNWTDGGNNIAAESDYVDLVASGITIGASSEFGTYGDGMIETTSLTAGTYYLGFRISLSDGVHYGYAQCTVAENGDDFDITWNNCYYNATVGASIVTGEAGGGEDPCDAIAASALPFFESFEGDDFGCWTQETLSGSVSWTQAASGGSYSNKIYPAHGSKLALAKASSHGVQTRLISPVFSVEGVNNLTLTFAHTQLDWTGDQDTLVVEYRLNGSSAWQTLAEYTSSISSWVTETITLPATSATLQIAFHAYLDYGYGITLDSLTLKTVSCSSPTITAVTPSDVSAVVTWTGNAPQYAVRLGEGDEEVVSGTSKTFTGLTPNTDYTVYVRAICGVGDESEEVSQSFHTQCVMASFPYSEDFEGFTANEVPDCWTNISGSNYVENSSSNASQGTKVLHMQGPGTIATPVINIAGNDVFVSFDMKCENVSTSGDMAIGVALSPSMIASAVWIDTIDAATTYNRYEYTFHNTYNLPSGCIIFKQVNTSATNYYYWIDSLTVSEPPACPKPINLTLNEATETSLTLSWTENGSASKWVVKVDDGAWTQTTDNPYTINGLTANTEYAVSVRSFCDPDTSDAVSGTFRTSCATEVVTPDDSFEEEFEGITSGIPTCWAQTDGTWKSYSTGYSGRGLYFSDYYSGEDTLITPDFNFTAMNNGAQLSFWYKMPEAEDWYGDTYTATLEVLYRTSTSGEWTVGETLTEAADNWTEHEFILPSSTNAASYQIALRALSSDAYTSTYVYLDNVKVALPPSCPKPSNLTAEVAESSVTLSWNENGSASQWLVKIDNGEWQTATNPYTINDLAANTEYSVSLRAFCGVGDTSDVVLGSFSTLCQSYAVPFSEEFEDITSGIPNCWDQEASNASSAQWASSTSGHSGRCLDFNDWDGEDSRLIFPVVDCSSLNANAQLSFYYKNPASSYSTNITAGLYYRTSSNGEWTAIEDWTLSSAVEDWTEAAVILPNSANASFYQVSMLATGIYGYVRAYLYLDDVYIGAAPTCVHPTEFSAATTTNEAVLTWTSDASNFEVRYSSDGSNWTSVTANSNTTTITGLTANTAYQFQVRAICAVGDTSTWFSTSATTACGVVAADELPYFNGFETDLNCWQQEHISGNLDWEISASNYSYTAVEGSSFVKIESASSTSQNETRLISPVFNTVGAEGLVLKFAHAQKIYSSYQDQLTVEYRLSPSDPWTTLTTYTDNIENFVSAQFQITQTSATFQFAFRANCVYGYGVVIDSLFFGVSSDEPQSSCDTPTGLAVSNITSTSAVVSWNVSDTPVTDEGFPGNWNLAMAENDSVHMTITPDAMMHTLLGYVGQDIDDVDENVSVAGTLIPVSIQETTANVVNVTGSFDMAMYGVTDPVTFHFATTGTVSTTGLSIEPADIYESVQVMGGMNIDYTGTITFVQPTAEPENGTLSIQIASLNITGYGDTTIMGMTGSVSIGMTASMLHASGTKDGAASGAAAYELLLTNTATGAESSVNPATTPHTFQNLTPATSYTVKVRALCDGGGTSSWSTAVPFTTLNNGEEPCDVPTGVTTSNPTASSVTVSWTGTASQYEVVVVNAATGAETSFTASSSPFTATGLTANTAYTVKVRAICADGNSDWSSAASFSTTNQGIDDVNANYSVSLFPNPADELVNLRVEGLSGRLDITVIDMSGRVVLSSVSEGDANVQLNVSNLAQGTYFVRVSDDNVKVVKKLVVK